MQVASIGIQPRHLGLAGLDHLRMAVAHMRHIIDRVQVSPPGLVIEVLHVAPDNLERFFVREAERFAEMLAPGFDNFRLG